MSDIDAFLKHYGVMGMKWGVTKSEYKALSRDNKKQYRKKTLKERSATYKKSSDDYTKMVINAAKTHGDNVYIATRKSNREYASTVMTGKEFYNYIAKHGVFSQPYTEIFGYANTEKGRKASAWVDKRVNKIWDPTAERYVKRSTN